MRRAQDRMEAVRWRAAASRWPTLPRAPILAPWWLSPATAYWSGQPTVAGSSHESLPGIVASARFFLATSAEEAEAILRRHDVHWVSWLDGERLAENSAAILGVVPPPGALCRVLSTVPPHKRARFSGPHLAKRHLQGLSSSPLKPKNAYL